MEHPDVLLDLFQLQHQDRLHQVEAWRLARAARQHGARSDRVSKPDSLATKLATPLQMLGLFLRSHVG